MEGTRALCKNKALFMTVFKTTYHRHNYDLDAKNNIAVYLYERWFKITRFQSPFASCFEYFWNARVE